jgi:hypothetical protein
VSSSSKPEFNWLDKYICTNLDQSNQKTSEMSEQVLTYHMFLFIIFMGNSQSSDIPVLRHQLAHGQAASNRESILRYQLKLKEPEYIQHQQFWYYIISM